MASRHELEHFLDSTFHRQEDGWIASIVLRKGVSVGVRIVYLPGDTAEGAGLVMTTPLVAADAHPCDDVLAAIASFPFGVKRYGNDVVLYHFVYTANVDENEILVPARALADCADAFTIS